MQLPAGLLAAQDGVVSRAQLFEHGLADHDLRRLVRRRELCRLHPGVYVSHTGPPTWRQRAWGAVLAVSPAVLSHGSAVRAHGIGSHGIGSDGIGSHGGLVHVAVDRHRSVCAPVGVRAHYRSGVLDRAWWHLSPPRVRLEDAVLDLAADADREDEAVAVLAGAVQAGGTTPAHLRAALARRPRLPRRPLLAALLGEVGEGVRSPLERRYRQDVERAHRLPRGDAQSAERVDGRLEVRDVVYRRFGLVVELDGRLGHADPRGRARDLSRDLRQAVQDRQTLRLGWVQVAGEACATAFAVGSVLRGRGWRGAPAPCVACAGVPRIPATW